MNSRSTIVLVGIFLAIFWIGGLMMTVNRQRVDASFVMPTLQSADKVEIDRVQIERKDKDEYKFVKKGDDWTLSQGNQAVKVESFRVRDLIRAVKDAKRAEAEDGRPVDVSGGLAAFGLKPPQTVITLTGQVPAKDDRPAGKERSWSIFLGNESPDKKYVYAATSDAPEKVVALSRERVSALLFKNINDFRSKRLFEFSEPTVQSFTLKEGEQELSIKKSGGAWVFVKPNLGYAEADTAPPVKTPPGHPPALEGEAGGVKTLIGAINAVRVDSEDDFVTSAADTLARNDLLPGKEKLKIQVLSGDDKKPTDETVLVGREEKGYYYARLATDEGVFKLPAKTLAPLFEAIKSPEKLRSRDLAPMPIKDADAVVLTQGKEEVRFLAGGDPKIWVVQLPGSTGSPANSKFVEKMIDTLQGRREIVAFKDVANADAAKVDAELGFDQPTATVAVYVQGVEGGKTPKAEPALKKDAKAAATWQFGKVDGGVVWVKRTLEGGVPDRFSVKKSILDALVPSEGLIGYLEPVLPKVDGNDVFKIDIDRGGGNTIALEKIAGRWMLKDAAGDVPADPRKIEDVIRTYTSLGLRRWVKKVDAKDDLDAYGLKSPALTVTLTVKDALGAKAIGSALGQLGGITGDPALTALGAAWANAQAGEKIVYKFGKEGDKDDAGNLFVQSSQTDRIGLASQIASNLVRDLDFRDRSTILNPEVQLVTLAIGQPAAPMAALMDASPLTTLVLGKTSADKVNRIRVTLRTPVEVRTFQFIRKDKAWVDEIGLKEFQVNDAHIDEVAAIIAELKMDRVVSLTGGPKADQKLSSKDAVLVIDAAFSDLRPPMTLTIGTNFEGFGCFAQVTTWPGAVFLINGDRIQPLLRGAGYFAKERVAAN